MVELRYKLTGLLENEYKRRTFSQQKSIQRINELKAQVLEIQVQFLIFYLSIAIKIENEKKKSFC